MNVPWPKEIGCLLSQCTYSARLVQPRIRHLDIPKPAVYDGLSMLHVDSPETNLSPITHANLNIL